MAINLTIGENGIFKTAEETKHKQKIAEYTERIELARGQVALNNMGEVTLDKLIDKICENNISKREGITKLDEQRVKIITKEGYIFIITVSTVENVKIIDTTAPQVSIQFSSTNPTTTTSLPVQVSANITNTDNESGINIAGTKWILSDKPEKIGTDKDLYTGEFTNEDETTVEGYSGWAVSCGKTEGVTVDGYNITY